MTGPGGNLFSPAGLRRHPGLPSIIRSATPPAQGRRGCAMPVVPPGQGFHATPRCRRGAAVRQNLDRLPDSVASGAAHRSRWLLPAAAVQKDRFAHIGAPTRTTRMPSSRASGGVAEPPGTHGHRRAGPGHGPKGNHFLVRKVQAHQHAKSMTERTRPWTASEKSPCRERRAQQAASRVLASIRSATLSA